MNKTHRASKGGKAADHTSPLRKIVETVERPIYSVKEPDRIVGWMPVEVLECGHEQHIKSDLAGHYYAQRRRCKKCAREIEENTET
jgi:hypothetical protein